MSRYTITIKRQVRTIEVSLTNLSDEITDLADDSFEPSNVIDTKCEAIADILGCSYEEAERIVLSHE